jgi:hypothetical protein
MASQSHLYVDVAGTDYSAKVLGLPKASRVLSDVGECDVVISNKGGALKSAFSEMQRVGVSAARAAIPFGDYFTGTDGAAPNATNWPTVLNSVISGNKLRVYNAAADAYCISKALSTPITFSCWVKHAAGAADADIYNTNGPDWYLYLFNAGHDFALYTEQSGVLDVRAQGGSWTNDTWYRVVGYIGTATIRFCVYDVYGVLVWDSTSKAIDALSSTTIRFYAYDPADLYVDSVLATSSATVVADQLFEGYVDSIEYGQSPDTITLHCVDDAIELEKQYDDTYGRDTGTFTPAYGTTDDISAIVSAVLPTGWTYTCPDCAIHDMMIFSTGTRRLAAINQILDHTPYLGWYVLPMKHIVFVMPDTYPAPDAWTESIVDWADYGTNSIDVAADDAVDGEHNIKVYQTGAAATTLGDLRLGFTLDIEQYRYMTLYYTMIDFCTAGTFKVRIRHGVAANYWEYTCPDQTGISGTEGPHFTVRLPDTSGNHGWVPGGTPNVATDIERIQVECGTTGAGAAHFCFDVLYFYAAKKLTSKYTVSNIIGIQRLKRSDFYNRVIVKGSGIANVVVDDATAQAIQGVNELVVDDQSITTTAAAQALARGVLNAEGWDDTGDPIQCTIVNPGDMYNVMLGDTLTVTVANLNLSSATRTLISRVDSITEQGWRTILNLSNDVLRDNLRHIWNLAKRKRY